MSNTLNHILHLKTKSLEEKSRELGCCMPPWVFLGILPEEMRESGVVKQKKTMSLLQPSPET